MAEEQEYITGLEPEAEDMIRAFPKNPVVCADLHSIAVSLKRIADLLDGTTLGISVSDTLFNPIKR